VVDAATSSPRVLVVEDDESLCVLLEAALKRESLSVQCTNSAESAIDLLRERDFDVVVLDLMLAGSSGHYVLGAIRQLEAKKRPRVLVITGASSDAVKTIDRNIAKSIMFKPLDLVSFAPVVRVEADRAAALRRS
jgi:DNA-binding response OmpR family regulator